MVGTVNRFYLITISTEPIDNIFFSDQVDFNENEVEDILAEATTSIIVAVIKIAFNENLVSIES